jgi:hypothetical protein
MSYVEVEAVLARSKSKGANRLVLIAIASRIGIRSGVCWPSLERIAADANVAVKTVLAAIAELVESGELVIRRGAGKNGANIYRVTIDPENLDEIEALDMPPARSEQRQPPIRGCTSTDRGCKSNRNEPEFIQKQKTKHRARSQSSRGGAEKKGYWGDGCPEFPNDPVRIDRAGSPRPPKQPPPQDPLMQARSKPKSSAAAAGGGGPLFGEPEPVKVPADEIVVRDTFQAAYEKRHGMKAKWGAAEAKHAKGFMRSVREGAEKRRTNPETVLVRVVSAYLNDQDPFLDKNGYPFLLLNQRSIRYISEVLKLGTRGNNSGMMATGSW